MWYGIYNQCIILIHCFLIQFFTPIFITFIFCCSILFLLNTNEIILNHNINIMIISLLVIWCMYVSLADYRNQYIYGHLSNCSIIWNILILKYVTHHHKYRGAIGYRMIKNNVLELDVNTTSWWVKWAAVWKDGINKWGGKG